MKTLTDKDIKIILNKYNRRQNQIYMIGEDLIKCGFSKECIYRFFIIAFKKYPKLTGI